MKHELDDNTVLLWPDGTSYDEDQRYGFFTGLAEFQRTRYQRDRMQSYPSIGDQLDMLWHMMDDETIPGKNSEWYNCIVAVKNQFPKS